MIIKELTVDSINIYDVKLKEEELFRFKKKIITEFEDSNLLKNYELSSSIKNLNEFKFFLLGEVHEDIDFGSDECFMNSGGNSYIQLRETRNNIKTSIMDENCHTFQVILDMHYPSKNIQYQRDLNIAESARKNIAFYMVLNPNENKFGECHTSEGLTNKTIIQIPFLLYYLSKAMQGKFYFINEAVKKGLNIDDILSLIEITTISSVSLEQIKKLLIDNYTNFIDTDYSKIITSANNTTGLVKKLKSSSINDQSK